MVVRRTVRWGEQEAEAAIANQELNKILAVSEGKGASSAAAAATKRKSKKHFKIGGWVKKAVGTAARVVTPAPLRGGKKKKAADVPKEPVRVTRAV